jgi:hypothetical protein
MTSKLRTPVCLAVMALAICAAFAPAASATPKFESETYPALISGEQTEQFEFKSEIGTMICKGATFAGEMSAASEKLSLAPTFKECSVSGTASVVETGGCTFVAHGLEESGKEEFDSLADIACPGTATMKIHMLLGCMLTINGQVNLSDFHWNLDLSFPPRLELVSKLAQIQGKLENTPGKTCLLGTKSITLSAGGKAVISSKDVQLKPQGMFIK